MTNSTNQAVANAWAKGKSACSANRNFSTNGATLWSYRTPIARIVETAKGERIALIDERRYSVTTEGKHVNAAYRAMGYKNLFRVPVIMPDVVSSEDMHKFNLRYLKAQAELEAHRIRRARVHKGQEQLDRLVHRVSEYREAFGLAA